MSLFAAALLLASPAQSVLPATPLTDEEIVVIGRRLRYVQFSFEARKGKLRFCRITKSTGDKVLDKLTCEAAKTCAAQRPKTAQDMANCMGTQREAVLAALKAAQVKAQGTNAQN